MHLEDDLDGGPADETVTFALDGCDYEIDLSDNNAEKLRKALRLNAAAGRKTTRTRRPGSRASGSNPDTARIHAWAKANGNPVSVRGQIHQHICDAYYTAHRLTNRTTAVAHPFSSGWPPTAPGRE